MFRGRAAVIAVVLMVAAGCSSDGGSAPSSSVPGPTSPPASSTPTPSPKPTESASATAAKRVYTEFREQSAVAERAPNAAKSRALKTLAVDQAFSELDAELIAFRVNGLAFRGEPPTPRLSVVSDVPDAKPYPMVQLKDCPTVSTTWKPYNTRTNRPAKTVPATVQPPYPTSVTVIFFEGRWKVQKTITDRTVTCSS